MLTKNYSILNSVHVQILTIVNNLQKHCQDKWRFAKTPDKYAVYMF